MIRSAASMARSIEEIASPSPAELSQQNVLSRSEAAAYLRLSVSTLDRLVREGELTPKKMRRRVVFSRAVLDAWLNPVAANQSA